MTYKPFLANSTTLPPGAMPAPMVAPEISQSADQPQAAPGVDSGAEVANPLNGDGISPVPPTVIESATPATKPTKPKTPKPKQAPGQTALFTTTYEPLRQAAEQAKVGWNELNAEQRQTLLKRTGSGAEAHATLDYDALPHGVQDDLARLKLARMAKNSAAKGEFIATHTMANDGTPVRENLNEKGRPVYGEYLDRDGTVRQGVAQAIGTDYDQDVPNFSSSTPVQGGGQAAAKTPETPVAPSVEGGGQPAKASPLQVQPPTQLPPFQPPPPIPPYQPTPAPTRPVNSIDEAAHIAATSPQNNLPEPTQAQKKAGNYKKGHVRAFGLDLSIENPEGSERKGTDAEGKPWSVKMHDHYGYIKGTEGRDKDHIDLFIKPGTPTDYAGSVFVVDQNDPTTGQFDEHKVMTGYATPGEAKQAYLRNYSRGWKGLGAMTEMPLEDFKNWLASGNTKKPVAAKPSSPVISPNPPAKAPFNPETDLTHVRDVYGKRHLVYRQDLENSNKTKIRISDSDGRRNGSLHRENILPDQTAPTPYYADRPVIGVEGKSERDPDTRAFATALAAKSFQTKHFLKDTHRVEPNPNPGGSGFVLVRNTSNPEKPAKNVEATSALVPPQEAEATTPAAPVAEAAPAPASSGSGTGGVGGAENKAGTSTLEAENKSENITGKTNANTQTTIPDKPSTESGEASNSPTVQSEMASVSDEGSKDTDESAANSAPQENRDVGDNAVAESADIARARADLKDALADLGQVLLDAGLFSKKMMPTPELDAVKLFPVLTRVMDAAFRLGYHSFKENARFVLAQIRESFGDRAADALTLDHLQGSYIAMAGQYQGQGADSKRDVVGIESLDELLDRGSVPQVTSQPAPQQRAEPVPALQPAATLKPEPTPSPNSATTASLSIADVPGTFLANHKVKLPLYDTQRHVYVPGEATAHEALTALRQDIKAHEDLRKRVKKCQEASHAS